MDNSGQALNYAVFRWGMPLALFHLLDRDCGDERRAQHLLTTLKSMIPQRR
jgi:hypothetical protein